MATEGPRGTISSYYDAMNKHDPEGMLAACSDSIYVTFPEEHRNWRSLETARVKFSTMFEALKGFNADWKFEEPAAEDADSNQGVIVRVRARFTAQDYDAQRLMKYILEKEAPFKIKEINHIDV